MSIVHACFRKVVKDFVLCQSLLSPVIESRIENVVMWHWQCQCLLNVYLLITFTFASTLYSRKYGIQNIVLSHSTSIKLNPLLPVQETGPESESERVTSGCSFCCQRVKIFLMDGRMRRGVFVEDKEDEDEEKRCSFSA